MKAHYSDASRFNFSPRFKLVPPAAVPPTTPPATEPQPTPQSPATQLEKKPFPYTGWLIFGSVVVALGAIAQIPVSPSIRAEAWLEADPNNRSVVHMEISGKITEILVEPNKAVTEDQPLALIESQQLEEEIGEWNLRYSEKASAMETANQQIITAKARLDQVFSQEARSRQRLEELQQELLIPSPQIQALQSQAQSLKASGESLDLTISRYQKLSEQGAYPLEKVNELQRQKTVLDAQVSQQVAVVESAKKQLRDELKARQDEYDRLVAQRRVAEQESMAARTSVTSQLPLVEALHKEVAKRQNRQTQNQVLRAPKSGTVITQNLYPLKGKTLQKGEAVLEIADPSKLVAVIEVRQEDADLVKPGAIVTFNPPEPGLPSFTTQIKEVVTVLERDKMQQKSMLQVIAVIDSQGDQLKPGAKVYAKIASPEPIPLYEKCRREFFNLFKVRSL